MIMIMITHTIYGGLGNQLYQIFTTIALAIRCADTCVFHRRPPPPQPPGQIEASGVATRITHWDTIFANLAPYVRSTDPAEDATDGIYRYSQPSHAYTPIEFPQSKLHLNPHSSLYVIDGYFQSYKYFDREFDTICRYLDIEGQRAQICEWIRPHPVLGSFAGPIVDQCPSTDNSCVRVAMHFRIGDYKTLSHHHPIMPAQYYERALTALLKSMEESESEVHIYLFYDTSEEPEVTPIVAHLQQRIVCPPGIKLQYHHVPPQITQDASMLEHDCRCMTDPEHLLLMSMCTHFIIANSTFSLWAAHFSNFPSSGRRPPSKVYYPSVWFGRALQSTHDVRDMFPKEWIRIDAQA